METPEMIGEWASSTFGNLARPEVMAARVNCEAAELHLAIMQDKVEEIYEEAADVYITLCHMASNLQKSYTDVGVVKGVFSDPVWGIGPMSIPCVMYSLTTHADSRNVLMTMDLMIEVRRLLATIEAQYDFFLQEAVDAKMKINRARSWSVVNGVGQHISLG